MSLLNVFTVILLMIFCLLVALEGCLFGFGRFSLYSPGRLSASAFLESVLQVCVTLPSCSANQCIPKPCEIR